MICWTIVVAAGSGSRFGTTKQFEDIGGMRVVDRSVATAKAATSGVVVVVGAADFDTVAPTVGADAVVPGARSRAGSVRCGLAAVPESAEVILVHDAVRPFASTELYASVIEAIRAGADAALPAVPVVDTIKRRRLEESGAMTVLETLDRSELMAAQTPQGFRADVLRRIHSADPEASDDAGLVEASGGKVVLVSGEPTNFKITYSHDLVMARVLSES